MRRGERDSFDVATVMVGFALMVALPLAGIVAVGRDPAAYLAFFERPHLVQHAAFSWLLFCLAAAVQLLVVTVVIRCLGRTHATASTGPDRGAFPWWGWAGVALGICAWILAWTRFPWFTPLQRFTFTPLWVAYVLTVNALTRMRKGSCVLTRSPGRLLLLFPISALFWWFFEYMNHFVENWSYNGSAGLAEWRYIVEGSISFSTALPAVVCTRELLATVPRLRAALDGFPPIPLRHPRVVAGGILAAGCGALFAVGIWPTILFPCIWMAPVAVIGGLRAVRGRRTMFSGVVSGNWRAVGLYAAAGLVCGVFWEMWNEFSFLKWAYHVSYLEAFRVFEMPLLGYAGYVPFGMFCGLVVRALGLAREGE